VGGENGIGGAGARKRKRYHTTEYNTLKLCEYMKDNKDHEPFSIYQLMKCKSIHMQRRDRMRQSLRQLIEWGWVEVVSGPKSRYRVTEKGEMAYLEAKKFLEFYEGARSRTWCPLPPGPFGGRQAPEERQVNFVHA